MTSSTSPLISICLPVFNGGKFLAAAIESVLAQSLGDFELLIADDGSTDASAEISSNYVAQDKRIKYWKNEARQGLFGNYNACIRKASAKFIKPFAQDDLLDPDSLKSMATILQQEPNVVLVSSSRQIIDETGNLVELKQPIKENMRARGADVIMFHLIGLNNWIGEPSTVLFRAEFAGSGFDPSYYHYGDIEYWLRILKNGDYCYLANPLASFRRHGLNETDKNHLELYDSLDVLRMSLDYRENLSDLESESLLKRRLIEKIALEHSHIVEDAKPDDLFKKYCSSFLAEKASDSSELQRLEAKAAGFRLLASMSLSTVSELIAELDHEKRCRFDEQERFASEVNKMRESLYWKLSSPLRKLRNAIKGNPES